MNTAGKKRFMFFISIIGWFALILQFYLITQKTGLTGFSTGKLVTNYFSYFTILSNIFAVVCVTVQLLTPAGSISKFFSGIGVQSAIALYIAIVGIVYNTVLRFVWDFEGWDKVANELLHVIDPVLYLIYWYIYVPKGELKWKQSVVWLIFPLIYIIYSLIRGPIADWYPYFFINVKELGYSTAFTYMFFVFIAFLVAGLLIVWIDGRLGRRVAV